MKDTWNHVSRSREFSMEIRIIEMIFLVSFGEERRKRGRKQWFRGGNESFAWQELRRYLERRSTRVHGRRFS